jgi:hypothetical protein
MKPERSLPRDRQLVWVAAPAMLRPPGTMAHHEPGRETEWGTASLCFYHHEWIVMRRDVAETFTRPCKVCARNVRRRRKDR